MCVEFCDNESVYSIEANRGVMKLSARKIVRFYIPFSAVSASALLCTQTFAVTSPSPSPSTENPLTCSTDPLINVINVKCPVTTVVKGVSTVTVAQGDGVTDDQPAIQAAIDSAGPWQTVYFPPGIYMVSAPINIGGKQILGSGTGFSTYGTTTIRAFSKASLSSVVYALKNSVQLSNLRVDGNEAATDSVNLTDTSTANMSQVLATGSMVTGSGFHFVRSEAASFSNLLSWKNGGNGFSIEGCNGTRFSQLRAISNGGDGIDDIPSSQVTSTGVTVPDSGGAYFSEIDLEENGGNGMLLKDVSTTTNIQNLWMESNGGNGILLNNTTFVEIHTARISGIGTTEPNGSEVNYVVRLTNGTKNTIIQGLTAGDSSGFSPYVAIQVDPGCQGNQFLDNYQLIPHTSPLPVNFQDRNTVVTVATANLPAAPTAGAWLQGDIIWNSAPSAGAPMGWMCVKSGTPGTWAPMPNLGN